MFAIDNARGHDGQKHADPLNGLRSHNPRVLVVEDDEGVLETLDFMLKELSYDVVARAQTLSDAVTCAAELDFEFAIVDAVVKGGLSVESVGAILRTRGIPFVLASGYSPEIFGSELQKVPTLRKPFGLKELSQVLAVVAPL
jgi:DNA-binding response OmpR family regulator